MIRKILGVGAILAAGALAACSGGNTSTQVVPSNGSLGNLSDTRFEPSAPTARSCAQIRAGEDVRCFAVYRTDIPMTAVPSVAGYGPADLQAAYKLPSSTNGAGQTIAIVDAYDDPNAAKDLDVYRKQFGLPPCTSSNGCFKKVNQTGGTTFPRGNTGWAEEISLDLDMASAGCPNCHILLVEATSATFANLGAAVTEAANLGANVISNSYGGSEFAASSAKFNHPGHLILASAGDSGTGAQQPCSFATVVCVGGTTLLRAATTRGWKETVWSGTGSGCSTLVVKPSWQTDTGCRMRSETDLSAVANPSTGVAVYDTYGVSGWLVFGGTSVSSPLIASVFALAGNAATLNAAQQLWGSHSSMYDITMGSNGSCSITYICKAGVGYDGPTGWGTPKGVPSL